MAMTGKTEKRMAMDYRGKSPGLPDRFSAQMLGEPDSIWTQENSMTGVYGKQTGTPAQRSSP